LFFDLREAIGLQVVGVVRSGPNLGNGRKSAGQTAAQVVAEALKREIVAASLAPGASVSIAARQYDVNTNMVFRVLVQIDRKTRLANMAVRRRLLYRAASTAFQTAGALRSLTHSLPMLNCPLWIRRKSSMPAIVIAAVLNHLNPSIGSMRSFTPR
jgi:hypothetical protein